MSSASFFSFGSEDSYISKSFEGLRYRDLPPSLHQLILSGSVVDVHWAALGPARESWVLSFKDSAGKNNLGWGKGVPVKLAALLSTTSPSPHLRVFLGPLARFNATVQWLSDSYIAWDPTFIRWQGLPPDLDECLQSWLTPSGWRAGPPRIVTWGLKDAFFAMSEYGEVECRAGLKEGTDETWPMLKETVDEWKSEKGFDWNDLAYISLDPVVADQFFAIRQDGTWTGSIDDSNEDALESFAMNFFAKAKARPKTKAKPEQQANGIPKPEPDSIPSAATQALYESWATETATSFAAALAANSGKAKAPKKLEIRGQSSRSSVPTLGNPAGSPRGKLLTQFPYLPTAITTCVLLTCVHVKADPSGLKACKHDVEKMFRASGLYSFEWLRQERLRWHPDRFGRLCDESFREVGRRLAEEMFKIIDSLIADLTE